MNTWKRKCLAIYKQDLLMHGIRLDCFEYKKELDH